MSIVPVVSIARMVAVLLAAGFKVLRQKGSHRFFQHPITKRVTMVAMHPGDLNRTAIKTILKQAGISLGEFLRLLGKK